MTEDETFKALKKWSYREAISFWFLHCDSKANFNKMLEPTGWTYEELSAAYVQYCANLK